MSKNVCIRENEFSWGNDKRSDECVCMYCGRYGKANPADYGLHFNDDDIFGEKYVCGLCDTMITQSNRGFKLVLDTLQKGDCEDAGQQLDNVIKMLQEVKGKLRDYIAED